MRIPSTLLPLFLQPVQLPVLKQLVRCIHTKERGFPFLLFSDRETERKVSKWILELKNRRDSLSLYIYIIIAEKRERERERE
jgi:hypothetical protein